MRVITFPSRNLMVIAGASTIMGRSRASSRSRSMPRCDSIIARSSGRWLVKLGIRCARQRWGMRQDRRCYPDARRDYFRLLQTIYRRAIRRSVMPRRARRVILIVETGLPKLAGGTRRRQDGCPAPSRIAYGADYDQTFAATASSTFGIMSYPDRIAEIATCGNVDNANVMLFR